MIFIYNNNEYRGNSAAAIVRSIENDTAYPDKGGDLKTFLIWSLAQACDRIPARELDVSPNLPEETIAFNYHCLLDAYEIGAFFDSPSTEPCDSEHSKVRQM